MAEELNVEVTLTPKQHEALKAIAVVENCEVSELLKRGADMVAAAYSGAGETPNIEKKIDRLHDHLIKLSVSLMKYTGQVLFYSTLPLKTGPLKGKLTEEGYSRYWHESEKYAMQLLSPPEASKGKQTTASMSHE